MSYGAKPRKAPRALGPSSAPPPPAGRRVRVISTGLSVPGGRWNREPLGGVEPPPPPSEGRSSPLSQGLVGRAPRRVFAVGEIHPRIGRGAGLAS
ncbi:hypothetical protein B5M47_01055 [candidate division CPR3 bacterium 4484_211]|uniref:Uncharacterized protein n=1 Tax=candidate division CPR3 bacterium 4484_211 TaxID=1968527 RepID=A0A1W9P0X5_UNCC3|nr:MAG: hypothetical protein B5M47_01055 [candidate division CPR3 bacterium 4484_211]